MENNKEEKILEIRGILSMLSEDDSQSIIKKEKALELNKFLRELKLK